MEVEEAVLVGIAIHERYNKVVSGGVYLDGVVCMVSPRVAVVWPTVTVCVAEGLYVVFQAAEHGKTVNAGSGHFQLLKASSVLVVEPDPEGAGIDNSGVGYLSA